MDNVISSEKRKSTPSARAHIIWMPPKKKHIFTYFSGRMHATTQNQLSHPLKSILVKSARKLNAPRAVHVITATNNNYYGACFQKVLARLILSCMDVRKLYPMDRENYWTIPKLKLIIEMIIMSIPFWLFMSPFLPTVFFCSSFWIHNYKKT